MSAISRRAILAACLALPVAARAQGPGPTAPAQLLDNGLLQIMHEGKATPFATRSEMLTPIVQEAFDLPVILRTAVGPRFASFSPESQQQLLQVFTEFTVASYVANFDSFDGQRFEILPEQRRFGSEIVVQTRFVPTGAQPVKLDYVVRPTGSDWKIVDVLLDGSISRVAVQRSDFRSVLESNDPGGLIGMLRNKVSGLASGEHG